jgi:ankyrin repeat protein
MNTIPPELMNMAVSYLNMDDTMNLAKTNKHTRRMLHSHLKTYKEIKKGANDLSIYNNYPLLKLALKNCEHYIVTSNELITDPTIQSGFHLIKFENWDQIDQYVEYFENRNLLGVIKILCEQPNLDYSKAFFYASYFGYADIVYQLLQSVETLSNAYMNRIIIMAAQRGHHKVIQVFLNDPQIDPSIDSDETFITICGFGHPKIVALFLNHAKINPASQNNEALIETCSKDWTYIYEQVFNEYALDESIQDIHSSIHIRRLRYYETAAMLLNDNRVDSSAQNNRALITASSNGHYKIVELLLKIGVNPFAQHKALINACSVKRVDPIELKNYLLIIQLLLGNRGVNPAANQNEAIRHASRNGHYEIVKLLLKDSRVDPSANDNEAIRYASRNGHFKVVYLLLGDIRVDPRANNNEAINSARKGRCEGHRKVVQLLWKF